MHRRSNLHLAALAATITAVAWAVLPAAQTPAPGQLRLILELGKTAVVIGEPLYATVRLINAGTGPVVVRPNVFPEGGAIRLDLVAVGGTRAMFQPMIEAFHVAPPRVLAPRQEISASFPMFFGDRGWTTAQAGTFQVQATYFHRPRAAAAEVTLSSTVALTVVDADPAGHLLMAGPEGVEAGKFLTWLGGDHLLLGAARLQDLVVRFPDSTLADYARMALGRNLSREFKNFTIDQVRPPEYARALAYLADVRADRLPPYLRIIHALEQARCLIRTGRVTEGRVWLAEGRRLIDGQTKWRQFAVQFDALALEVA